MLAAALYVTSELVVAVVPGFAQAAYSVHTSPPDGSSERPELYAFRERVRYCTCAPTYSLFHTG